MPEQSGEYALRSRLTNDPDAFKCWRAAGVQDLGEPVMENLCWTGCWIGSYGLSFASDGGYETKKSGETMTLSGIDIRVNGVIRSN